MEETEEKEEEIIRIWDKGEAIKKEKGRGKRKWKDKE